MRKTKELEINGKKVIVNELTVGQIKKLWKELTGIPETNETERKIPLFTGNKFLAENWPICIDGISIEEADDFTPSEMKLIYDAFLEVNNVFFDLATQVEGENPLIKGARMAICQELIARFALSSSEDIEMSGTTDTVSS